MIGAGLTHTRIWSISVSRRLRESHAFGLLAQGLGGVGRYSLCFARAHADAWRWMGRTIIRPFTGHAGKRNDTSRSADVEPTNVTMPDGVLSLITCAACHREAMGTNMRKYSRFRCPQCHVELLVIDAQRGISMPVPRRGQVKRSRPVEKDETEESEPVRA